MAQRIEDYALIGDCESAALVGRDGSIDWLCWPRFDSGACFAALLGGAEHGRWLLGPAGEVRESSRQYRGDTLVLETVFETNEGQVAVIDFMPPRDNTPDVVRIVEGRGGRVPMRMELVLRFDYGAVVPWVRRTGDGLRAVAGPEAVHLQTPVATHGENLHTVAEFAVSAGERVPFVLTWFPSHERQPPPRNAEELLNSTQRFWEDWIGRCRHRGPHERLVRRSLMTLKALTYAPTGGVVAAATTSLPERIGGTRNWDYRYCWVRDATFTLYALMEGGYVDEARAWREWLVRAVAGKPSELQIMYGLSGERRLTELELDWLPGYAGSAPVRIGNAAWRQQQHDVYGELMDALHAARRTGIAEDENAWRVQRSIMKHLAAHWTDPDDGIWEVRGPQRHFTHSKVMAWVATDRAVKAVESYGLRGPVEAWRALRERIHDEVCRLGFNPELNAFVQSYGGRLLDASLLMMPLVGFLPPEDPRVRGTVAAIERHLTRGGFVQRYQHDPDVDGLPHGEGAFLVCSFWLADNLVLQGRHDEAASLFDALAGICNDVGLLSEEYDPVGRRFLGNFPQALSHIGLVNTARNLDRGGGPAEQRGRKEGSPEQASETGPPESRSGRRSVLSKLPGND